MKLTKYTHSCIRLENEGQVLVVDPGSFSEVEEALDGAATVLVTHEHVDHLDLERVVPFLRAHPEVQVWAPAGVAADLVGQLGGEAAVHTAVPGETIEVEGFSVRTYGGQHALIHPAIPTIANIGYLVNEDLYHPGDAFIVPNDAAVKTLLLPLQAPWSKTQEVVDFLVSVRPERAYPIHDALLSERGLGVISKVVGLVGRPYGRGIEYLAPGTSVEL